MKDDTMNDAIATTALLSDSGRSARWPKLEDLSNAWDDAREDALWAYEAWRDERVKERRTAYAVFVAAADREQAAEREFLRATGHDARRYSLEHGSPR
jgi:hypothetical protein